MTKLFRAVTVFVFLNTYCYSQTKQLWGMTSTGGEYNIGVIFKTDGQGNNQTIQHSLTRSESFVGSDPYYGTPIQAADGKLYGMTREGGTNDLGVLFQYDPITNGYTKKIDFTGAINGSFPYGSLVQAVDGKLYGLTSRGGTNDQGVLFQYDPATSICTKKLDFAGRPGGGNPNGSLMLANDGKLYGVTSEGGASNAGVLFQYDPATNSYMKKLDLPGGPDGSYPYGPLIQAQDGMLYGTTRFGGANYKGVIFQYSPATNVYTKKLDFDGVANGSSPSVSLLLADDGKLYGMTQQGGTNNLGVLFQYAPATNTYTKKIDFAGAVNGSNPSGSLIQASNGKLYGLTYGGGVNSLGVLFQYDLVTSSYIKKVDFAGFTNGANPFGTVMQATDGKLYGLTFRGGENNRGSLFQYDLASSTMVKKFDFAGATNGRNPQSSLIQARDGKLYGMTQLGGKNDSGVLFEYDPTTQSYSKKYDFGGVDGRQPFGSLLQAANGKLYGLTFHGGANNKGVLFQFDPSTSTYAKKFDFSGVDGAFPFGSLMQGGDAKIYGVTAGGGTNNSGVLFQYDPATNLYIKKVDFGGLAGIEPYGSLIQLSDGKLFGMTYSGGINDLGVLFQFDPSANVFTKKVDFAGSTNGSYPQGSLVLAIDGKFYGMTSGGGVNDQGVLFQFDPATNSLTKKIDFLGATNGSQPLGSLMQASDGRLYGTTVLGGANNLGVLFQYDPATGVYTKKIDFTGTNGSNPNYSRLIEVDINRVITGDLANAQPGLSVSPNPVEEVLEIRGLIGELKNYELFDLSGRSTYIALEKRADAYTSQVRHLSQGIYVLRVQAGEQIHQIKFVKR